MKASSLAIFSALVFTLLAATAEARPIQCTDAGQLFEIYLRNHYASHKITDGLKARVTDQFIKGLDPSKTNFLESDVESLKTKLGGAFAEVQRGKCGLLEEAHALLVKRMQESRDYLDQYLGASYKFDENTDLILNPDLRGYSKTAEERNAYLAKMAHFQVSNYLMTDTKLDEAKRMLKKRNDLGLKRALERKTSDILDIYAEAFAHSLDPHSSYMSADVFEDFQIQMQLSLEGIGASLTSEDGYTVIEELIPGGAADKSKLLKPKDKIMAVAQDGQAAVTVMDMDLRDVVKLIRGKKGTKVKLTILRQGKNSSQFPVTLVRDKVDLKDQAAKLTFETRKTEKGKTFKIGVIDLPGFYGGGKGGAGRTCYDDVKKLVLEAKSAKVDGIILDLSRNGGGLLDQAVQIAGLFIKRGGVVATKSTEGRVEVLEDTDTQTVYSGPLAVLTSRLSASASEILAGAIKDYKRGLIIGSDHTFGKGTVQVLAPLPDSLGAMKVTTGMFFLPNGLSTQHLGVASDVTVPSTFNGEEIGEKKLDYSLDQQKIDAFASAEANDAAEGAHWVPIEGAWATALQKASEKRVDKSAKFAEIKKDLEDAAKNKGTIHLADIRKKGAEDKKKNGKIGKDGKKELVKKSRHRRDNDEDLPIVQESASILADLIELEHP